MDACKCLTAGNEWCTRTTWTARLWGQAWTGSFMQQLEDTSMFLSWSLESGRSGSWSGSWSGVSLSPDLPSPVIFSPYFLLFNPALVPGFGSPVWLDLRTLHKNWISWSFSFSTLILSVNWIWWIPINKFDNLCVIVVSTFNYLKNKIFNKNISFIPI